MDEHIPVAAVGAEPAGAAGVLVLPPLAHRPPVVTRRARVGERHIRRSAAMVPERRIVVHVEGQQLAALPRQDIRRLAVAVVVGVPSSRHSRGHRHEASRFQDPVSQVFLDVVGEGIDRLQEFEEVRVGDEGREVPHDVHPERRPVPFVQDESGGMPPHFPPLDAALPSVGERHRPADFMPRGAVYGVEAQVRVHRHPPVLRDDGSFMEFDRAFGDTDAVGVVVVVPDEVPESNIPLARSVEDRVPAFPADLDQQPGPAGNGDLALPPDTDVDRLVVQVAERRVDRASRDIDGLHRQTDARAEVTDLVSRGVLDGVASEIGEYRRVLPVVGHDGTAAEIQGVVGNADAVTVVVGVPDAVQEDDRGFGTLTVEPGESLVVPDLQSQLGSAGHPDAAGEADPQPEDVAGDMAGLELDGLGAGVHRRDADADEHRVERIVHDGMFAQVRIEGGPVGEREGPAVEVDGVGGNADSVRVMVVRTNFIPEGEGPGTGIGLLQRGPSGVFADFDPEPGRPGNFDGAREVEVPGDHASGRVSEPRLRRSAGEFEPGYPAAGGIGSRGRGRGRRRRRRRRSGSAPSSPATHRKERSGESRAQAPTGASADGHHCDPPLIGERELLRW